MKKLNKIILIIIGVLLLIFFIFFLIFGKEPIGLFFDKIGFTKNNIKITVSEKISKDDLYIYWLGETEGTSGEIKNKMLIYHKKIQSDIPSSYGKNWFCIEYKDKLNEHIGLLKFYAYSKHNYIFNIDLDGENLIIDWSIKNWYEPQVWEGKEIIKIGQ